MIVIEDRTYIVYIFVYCFRDHVFQSTLTKVIHASRAESTVKKYNNAVAIFQVWCRFNQVDPNFPSEEDIARYLIHNYNEDAPFSRIETAYFAIKWKLNCSYMSSSLNPCNSRFLQLLLDGLKRLLIKSTNRKEPITPEILSALVSKFDKGDLRDNRLCSMFLLAFAAFLRYDELSNIKLCDIEMYSSHINIFLEKSKTVQFREGAWVVVGATSSTGKKTCPVAMLRKYLSSAGISDLNSSEFLFRPLSFHKSLNKHLLT